MTRPLAGLSDRLPDPELLRDLLTPAADLIGSFHFIPELRGSGNYTYRLMVAEIEACYNERLSVARIAKSVNCSESYINHIFKKKSGMSVSSYINTVRVRHAKELLTSADEPVSAVAFADGRVQRRELLLGRLPENRRYDADLIQEYVQEKKARRLTFC